MKKISYDELAKQKVAGKESLKTEAIFDRTAHGIEKGLKFHSDILLITDKDADGITAGKEATELVEAMTGVRPTVIVGDRFNGKYGIPNVDMLPIKKGTAVICLDIGSTQRDALDAIEKITGEKPFVIDHHEIDDDMKDYPRLLNFTGMTDAPDYCTAGLVKRIFDVYYKENAGKITDKYPQMKDTVDVFACIGTIADCVSVNNPYDLNDKIIMDGFALLQRSAKELCESLEPSLGMFLEETGTFEKKFLTTEFFNYNVIPLLNACGRLEENGSEYVFKTFYDYAYDEKNATEHIQHMIEVNEQRKQIKQEVINSDEYKAFCQEIVSTGKNIAVYIDEDLPQGITGLIASDLTERLQVPAVVIARDASGDYVASGRNCDGYPNLFDLCKKGMIETVCLTSEIAFEEERESNFNDNGATYKGTMPEEYTDKFVEKHPFHFGGHANALGFSCDPKYMEVLKESFEMVYEDVVAEKAEPVYVDHKGLTVAKVMALEPYGVDFPVPQVCIENVPIENPKILKKNEDWKSFSNNDLKYITFTCGSQIKDGDIATVIGTVGINEYRGKANLQVQFDEVETQRAREERDETNDEQEQDEH